MSSGNCGVPGRPFVKSFILQHQAPDVVCDASLQAAHGLVMGLALRYLAVVVAAPDAVRHPHLGDGDQMQGGIELPVAAPRKPVAGPIAAGHLDGSDPRVARERRGTGEPRRTSRPAEQLSKRPEGHGPLCAGMTALSTGTTALMMRARSLRLTLFRIGRGRGSDAMGRAPASRRRVRARVAKGVTPLLSVCFRLTSADGMGRTRLPRSEPAANPSGSRAHVSLMPE